MAKKENASYEGSGARKSIKLQELEERILKAEDKFGEYLPLAGGKMIGPLKINYSAPALTLQNSDITKNGCLKMFESGGLQLYSTDSTDGAWDGTNTAQLILYPANAQSDLTKRVLVGWDGTNYLLYGEHNRSLLESYFLPLSGGTLTGALTVGGNFTATGYVRAKSLIQMTDSEGTTYSVIKLYPDSDTSTSYGDICLFCGGAGDTYIGSGESATNLYNALGASTTEIMYVCADTNIGLMPNCNTVANRKPIWITSAAVYPATSGSHTLGTSTYKWGQIYATSSSISTSDRNQKNSIEDLSDDVAAFILAIPTRSYKYNDGTSGRKHWGMIAQDIEEIMEDQGISASDFAGFIKSPKETSDEKTGELQLDLDDQGNIQYEYALRYEEFIAPLIKTVQIQHKKIEELEARIQKLEQLVGGGDNGMADA